MRARVYAAHHRRNREAIAWRQILVDRLTSCMWGRVVESKKKSMHGNDRSFKFFKIKLLIIYERSGGKCTSPLQVHWTIPLVFFSTQPAYEQRRASSRASMQSSTTVAIFNQGPSACVSVCLLSLLQDRFRRIVARKWEKSAGSVVFRARNLNVHLYYQHDRLPKHCRATASSHTCYTVRMFVEKKNKKIGHEICSFIFYITHVFFTGNVLSSKIVIAADLVASQTAFATQLIDFCMLDVWQNGAACSASCRRSEKWAEKSQRICSSALSLAHITSC